jgi:hypothetical protein
VEAVVNSSVTGWGFATIAVAVLTAGAVRATTSDNSIAVLEHQNMDTALTAAPLRTVRVSGFSVLAAISAEPLSLPPKTIVEMIGITNPLALQSETAMGPDLSRPVSLAPCSGFSVLGATSPEPMSLPPMTVAEMMLITNAITAAPFKSDATPGPFADKSFVPALRMKAKPNRKLAVQEPQQRLPSWLRLPWLSLR